ncbi:MAG TPA: hypothetical protein VMV74_05950 [Bacteroidales bacterium]|nr:hypothetical protein [Bacteroidales bacterium]
MSYRFIILALALTIVPVMTMSQPASDDLVSKCVLAAAENTTYLKDFRVQLPKAVDNSSIPVHKANMYLMKNMKYRFSLCNSQESKGELVITLLDQGKELISSLNKSTGKKYSSIDFICNKTGLYTLWFGFDQGTQGSGVSVVSMIK